METAGKRRRVDHAVRTPPALELAAHQPLLEAIAANPADPAPWTVYADLLQTADHPRGELISLMMERERRPSAKLLDAQRIQLRTHAAGLAPVKLDAEAVVGWRRGFANELRLEQPEQLAEIAGDESLRFVESVTLVIDDWAEWRMALFAARMKSWRRVRIESEEMIEAAPVFACAPNVQYLRIVGCEQRWEETQAPCLEQLVLQNVGEVGSLDDAELPVLEELWLLGESSASEELRTSLVWSQLDRIVLPEDTAQLVDGSEDEDEYENPVARATMAFVVIGRAIEPALVKKIAARMSIPHLSGRIAVTRGGLTVMQLFGTGDHLMPYGLAIGLGNVISPPPPIALVEIDADRAARYLVLGDAPARGLGLPPETVRKAIDLALGHDAGTTILDELVEAVAAAPLEVLLGNGGASQMTMTDPSTASLAEPPPDDDGDDDEDEDEYGDEYDYEDDLVESYEEPPVVIVTVEAGAPNKGRLATIEEEIPQIAQESIEVEEPVITDEPVVEDFHDAAVLPIVESDDALEPAPERVELWLDFREHYEDRAIAVDDEEGEMRWPDPERVANEFPLDVNRRAAEPTCAIHIRALVDCSSCGALYCVECGSEESCSACFGLVAEAGTAGVDDRPR